jgi:DNA invertase Pin-like site-specific DNA recombinase
VVGVFKETGSGVRLDRAERRKVLALAQARQIDAVLVTELSRWGRSTTDLLATLTELEARRVSVVALNGMTFDLATPHGRMMATVLSAIAEFERELIQERIRSGIAAAKARGKRLGLKPGQRPKSDRLASKVIALVAQGRSYRLIGCEVGLSKNTVAGACHVGRRGPNSRRIWKDQAGDSHSRLPNVDGLAAQDAMSAGGGQMTADVEDVVDG